MRPYILIVGLCALAGKTIAGPECDRDEALQVLSRDDSAASSFCSELLGTTTFVTEDVTRTIATTITLEGEPDTVTVTVTRTIDQNKKRGEQGPICRKRPAGDRDGTWSTWDSHATTTKEGNGPRITRSACSCLITAPTATSTVTQIETTITLPSTFTEPVDPITETTTAFITRSS